ncbi:hypothetical protein H072_3945 [Dactylellina haptotyla CBS 200.50]|uniref:Uncharacterized protein n=1 Tax=Dactylellina haptotyla (strain CBS 200.50) TaxID=1284197 RepID=S8ALR7_DACHA|nr:hypothetical protein H072_3945 [Dactylellina haptotyla CBS 200.50]
MSAGGDKKFTGDPSYPVFPNPQFISKFYAVSSQYSGLTHLDTDLYNRCYLPFNALKYVDKRDKDATSDTPDAGDATTTSLPSPRPTYQFDKPPCKRAAAINSNCYFQNTNGTFSGLQPYDSNFDIQQACFCEIYPYWDSISGCNECFRVHGGIEGDHWFPESYMSAASSAYCNASPITTAFYPFMTEWSKTAAAAQVPSTTAPDLLGTQTEASLYWTYATTITKPSRVAGESAAGRAFSVSKLTTWAPLVFTFALSFVAAS